MYVLAVGSGVVGIFESDTYWYTPVPKEGQTFSTLLSLN